MIFWKVFSSEDGFGLVEIAVALVIMGLIMGGILKGYTLVENARLRTVIAQINEYRMAAHGFYDRYGALPGDYDKASQYIQPELWDGDNDGFIRGGGLESRSGSVREAVSFWAHLSGAGFISDTGKPLSGAHATFGKGAPKSKMGGGMTIEMDPVGTDLKGLWFILGAENGPHGNKGLLTPAQAMSLDQADDDGNPETGWIRAREGAGTPAGNCVKNGAYNGSVKDPACVLYFQF
ncbi:MAG: prepilin-type N-terminal cleavage/methylation domain-containing protein [Alphaproteobacteria bacterium]|jgi:hypothetical protein|nr:prepilin-type N-terminal cleavage/methylation domain-containing protein [Alphaproteobacteria bacterium]MBT5655133.1 prepilin-type N-terminal cleavage/methylation domain-containing protein [Alphaproteobacteria bacterium]